MFDYVMTLMSFVYALAIAHILSTVGDLIVAGGRVRFSWLNAAWMVFALCGVIVWWLGMWGLRASPAWTDMRTVAVFFLLGGILYIEARMVCARIPETGIADLVAFHAQSGWKYMLGFAVLTGFTLFVNAFYFGRGMGDVLNVAANRMVSIQFVAALAAAFVPNRWVQWMAALTVGGCWAWYFAVLGGGN